MNNREVMQQALEALENSSPDQYPQDAGVFYAAKDALRTALEQQQAEPVAWDKPNASFKEWWDGDYEDPANPFERNSAAYWAWAGWKASQRPWQGLTEDDRREFAAAQYGWEELLIAAEAKLKEKNT